jgi:hypothetical protein
MDYKETNAFLKEVTPKLDDLVESGIINKSTEKKWLKMIKDQKMSPDELLKQVAKKESDKRNKDEGNVSIKLTGDAAKYFKLFQGSGPGSDQAWVAPPNSQGYDNRSGG